ncbi:MAG: S24/S26 family peptidase [Bacteroidales bacterium]|nr:S24/S26 family peptidase [Bacteroidales bacterium]
MKSKIINNELFFPEIAQLVESGERVLIRVKGNSMRPFISGDKDFVALEKPGKSSFKRGNILLVRLGNGHYVLHRIVQLTENHIKLRGDGNMSLFESCSYENVIAEATEVKKESKSILKGSLRWNLYKYLWPANPFLRRVAFKLGSFIP